MKRRHNHLQDFVDRERIAENRSAREDAAFEMRSVRFVLTMFKLTKREAVLRSKNFDETRCDDLTYRVFNGEYPSFPLLLATNRLDDTPLHTTRSAFLPALFKTFKEAPFFAAYETVFEQMQNRMHGRAIGLIFPRKGIPNGLVIHNGEDLDQRMFCGTVLTYQTMSKGRTRRLFVQTFRNLITRLHNGGHGWRP